MTPRILNWLRMEGREQWESGLIYRVDTSMFWAYYAYVFRGYITWKCRPLARVVSQCRVPYRAGGASEDGARCIL